MEDKQQLYLWLAESNTCSLECGCVQKRTKAVNICREERERNDRKTERKKLDIFFKIRFLRKAFNHSNTQRENHPIHKEPFYGYFPR